MFLQLQNFAHAENACVTEFGCSYIELHENITSGLGEVYLTKRGGKIKMSCGHMHCSF